MLTKVIARELAQHGIRVVCVGWLVSPEPAYASGASRVLAGAAMAQVSPA
jgi:NAD(P)-dependent dehydrogenase (short-subunit alcohol dehydrogenase family)